MKILATNVYVGPNQYAHFPVIRHQVDIAVLEEWPSVRLGPEFIDGLVEALPECGGYKVHKDKLVRMGVPIYTRHTVVSANGGDHVESVTIAAIDDNWEVIPGTERSFECDTLLIAVGLDPCDEFYHKAKAFGMKTFAAGDASEIAEASAAIFSGNSHVKVSLTASSGARR